MSTSRIIVLLELELEEAALRRLLAAVAAATVAIVFRTGAALRSWRIERFVVAKAATAVGSVVVVVIVVHVVRIVAIVLIVVPVKHTLALLEVI